MNVQRATKRTHTHTNSRSRNIWTIERSSAWISQFECHTRYYDTLQNNKNRSFSLSAQQKNSKSFNEKRQELGCYRKQLYKPSLQFSAACGATFVSYLFKREKSFVWIRRVRRGKEITFLYSKRTLLLKNTRGAMRGSIRERKKCNTTSEKLNYVKLKPKDNIWEIKRVTEYLQQDKKKRIYNILLS